MCELVSLSPELLEMGDEPSAGKRYLRRRVASAEFCLSAHLSLEQIEDVAVLSRTLFISHFVF